MHEGVLFRRNNFWRNDSCENLDNFSHIRLLYMHRWCLHGLINSYYSFWWNNLILCRYNADTLNICMKEFGSQKIILTKWQLWELTQLFPYMAFEYAWTVPLWADQLLLQLLMEQFDTLRIQCRHIEHMHEGVLFRKNNFWRNDSCENLDNFSHIRLLYMHRWCLHGLINSYYSFWWNNLILCRYNADTLNICMKEFGSQKIILTKWQLWELTQLFPYMAFEYAWTVPLWADQLLLQLLMEQFDTLRIQCRHIEHMHEGVYNFCLHRFYWNLLIKTKVFLFEL